MLQVTEQNTQKMPQLQSHPSPAPRKPCLTLQLGQAPITRALPRRRGACSSPGPSQARQSSARSRWAWALLQMSGPFFFCQRSSNTTIYGLLGHEILGNPVRQQLKLDNSFLRFISLTLTPCTRTPNPFGNAETCTEKTRAESTTTAQHTVHHVWT